MFSFRCKRRAAFIATTVGYKRSMTSKQPIPAAAAKKKIPDRYAMQVSNQVTKS
jgi:hypothetical protein